MIEWRKASRSNASGGECVEVSTNVTERVLIRDSKDPDGSRVAFEWAELAALLRDIKRGAHDL
ncbi:DUF397 domain-containing protein [Actinomadura hibisca]|uniref:DUF397 domain-containing protein n=1 Tax=Actinomadura hibisca TaxID=68565 RepID=UPI00082BCE69|nr:DUF397 domain-containing protein [Actinomadura hibisca]